jgi:deaminated glutathione amidase
MKEDHWETLLRARAIENTVFVYASNQICNIFSGRSMIVDPMGVIVTSEGEEENLIISDIDLDGVHRVREKLPSVVHSKPEFATT